MTYTTYTNIDEWSIHGHKSEFADVYVLDSERSDERIYFTMM